MRTEKKGKPSKPAKKPSESNAKPRNKPTREEILERLPGQLLRNHMPAIALPEPVVVDPERVAELKALKKKERDDVK